MHVRIRGRWGSGHRRYLGVYFLVGRVTKVCRSSIPIVVPVPAADAIDIVVYS